MPKPNFNAVAGIIDPMLNDNYEVILASIPGGGDNRKFTIQCKTATKPGSTIENVEYALFGHSVVFASKRTWTHETTLEYYETDDGLITTQLENWANIIKNEETQHGAFKKEYAVLGQFNIYRTDGSLALRYEMLNVWPKTVPEHAMDGAGGTNITYSISFAFDKVKRIFSAVG